MMRKPATVMMFALGLAACGSSVPDSNPASGQDYNSYLQSRSNGASQSLAAPVTAEAPTSFSPDLAASAIDKAQGISPGTQDGSALAGGSDLMPMDPTGQMAGTAGSSADTAAGPATSPSALPPIDANACAGRGNAFAGIQETTSEMNYVQGGVSDEQDFDAVKSRETIASDKQRIECNREQYVVVQPGALPQRPGDEGPNIAAYALSTSNAPGQKIYSRPPFYLTDPAKACAKFASPDLAQQAFLAAGGPQRDRKALDPDGDGFACSWDPRPFRNAKK